MANMALHCVKTIEAAALKENESCEFGLMKFLIILNLVMTTFWSLSKLRKAKCFKDVCLQTWLKSTCL